MRFYHCTDAAEAIMWGGFKDGTTNPMNALLWPGVWLSDRPLSVHEGAKGDTILVIEIPEEEVTPYEFVYDGGWGYREFLISAEIVNRHRPFTVMREEW